MCAKIIDEVKIEIGKNFKKGTGWVAKCQYRQTQYGYTPYGHEFLPTTPITEEDKVNCHKQKFHRCSVDVPQDYTGLLVSDSASYAERKTERWYYWVDNGEIIDDSNVLSELISDNV